MSNLYSGLEKDFALFHHFHSNDVDLASVLRDEVQIVRGSKRKQQKIKSKRVTQRKENQNDTTATDTAGPSYIPLSVQSHLTPEIKQIIKGSKKGFDIKGVHSEPSQDRAQMQENQCRKTQSGKDDTSTSPPRSTSNPIFRGEEKSRSSARADKRLLLQKHFLFPTGVKYETEIPTSPPSSTTEEDENEVGPKKFPVLNQNYIPKRRRYERKVSMSNVSCYMPSKQGMNKRCKRKA
ncbi:unnamed protein product [Orchesella dallaii]|uniref:Shugoshin C-terminal domain-containing protein n=1 Tax=Orchesella dallaii TaxID=48710 RepID=A0ABP1RPL1_9HEXA